MDLFRQNKQKVSRRIVLLFLSFGIALFAVSCNPHTSHALLSFFFDGVPEPEPQRQSQDTVRVVSAQQVNLLAGQIQHFQDTTVTTLNLTLHPDYQKKACNKCHEMEHSYRLKNRQPKLCYQCHKPFESRFSHLHGPVAAGFCLACHVPHKSINKALVKMPVQRICRHCHEAGDVNKNEAHKKTSATNCLQCHDAHGGETVNLLKKDIRP